MDMVGQSPPNEDYGLRRATGWKLVLCWTPKTCFLSGKRLWGTQCYKGTRVLTGPGDPIIEDYYIDKTEFLIWNLKGKR
jgi:hypothetical protein